MSTGAVLLDILVVLVAAKLAAEVAERINVPAVVGEIIAGVIIGPSVLGLVNASSVLSALGELGVILLLLEVGMSMRLEELGAVGRAAVLVATVGVILPSLAGIGVGLAFGHDFNTSLFLGAALAATSVGITARVFSDLRALATVEARTVLGAAVADDVMGLVVLTVVVRIATGGSVSAWSIAGIVAIAIGFLVFTAAAGQWLGPRFFAFVDRYARSAGTMVALALAFTLAIAKLADAAKLAPIVGAFVAGISLSGSAQRERIERELRPVGHLFIPVFFLEIGIEAHVQEFAKPAVLGIASLLLAVAVIGKLFAALGAIGSPGDKPLIGLGMIPRGEVGLIFASIGLQVHVLGRDLYAALLLVVLVSTLMTPPLLRWRLSRLRARAAGEAIDRAPPPGGWLRVRDTTVELSATPPRHLALNIGLETAVLLTDCRPASELLDWFGELDPEQPLAWDEPATRMLFRVLLNGNERSWRFLEATGLLERALPELAAAFARRRSDPIFIDPNQVLQFSLVEEIRDLSRTDSVVRTWWTELSKPELLLLAALILDITGGEPAVTAARNLADRLNIALEDQQEVALLVGESGLLSAASNRVNALSEEVILELAVHLESRERASALAIMSVALENPSPAERARLEALVALIRDALERSSVTGQSARGVVEQRRADALEQLGSETPEADRIRSTPRAHLLATSTDDLVRQARLLEPLAPRRHARVRVSVLELPSQLRIEVATRDRIGLLATVTGVLTELDLDVLDAVIATWPDGAALESFRVIDRRFAEFNSRDFTDLGAAITRAIDSPLESCPEPRAAVSFDDSGSPWYTLCEVRAPDRKGLLRDIAAGFAVAGASVHSASVSTAGLFATDRFHLTDRNDRKLSTKLKATASDAIHSGVSITQRRLQRGRYVHRLSH